MRIFRYSFTGWGSCFSLSQEAFDIAKKIPPIEASKAIRNEDRPDASEIPIIAMTANVFEEDKKLSYEAGMNEHIQKPFNKSDIKKILKKIKEFILMNL